MPNDDDDVIDSMAELDELEEFDDDDDYYDGQPDEAQEWHDFDPDC